MADARTTTGSILSAPTSGTPSAPIPNIRRRPADFNIPPEIVREILGPNPTNDAVQSLRDFSETFYEDFFTGILVGVKSKLGSSE